MEEPQHRYVIPTVQVDPQSLAKLDTKNSSRERDAVTAKLPSQSNVCQIQLWEVYLAVAILILQPPSSIVSAHVKALCEHNEPSHLCEAVLKEHTAMGTVTNTTQDTTLYTFFEEYMHRKFQIQFTKNSLTHYIARTLDDPLCGANQVPRVFLLGPHVQAFLLNAPFWEDQYDELIDAMRGVNLPANDVLQDGETEIGEAVDLSWDNAKLYDDPNMILKKYGGWAVTKAGEMIMPKDQLIMRLTGLTLEQILKGEDIPDSPRVEVATKAGDAAEETKESVGKIKRSYASEASSKMKGEKSPGGLSRTSKAGDGMKGLKEFLDTESEGSHASDYEVDPEHPKVIPFGVTLTEMYLLVRGLFVGLESGKSNWKGAIVAEQVSRRKKDGHLLAAAVLVDLYMREQIDVHHWTLTEGSIAVAYRAEAKKGSGRLEHFLDDYVEYVETIFRDMRLPSAVGEGPIWASLEERCVIDNHRSTWGRAYGCGYSSIDVWDLVRPDLLLDLRDGYVTAARVLYDKEFPDPLDEESNDVLMFCHLLQLLFDDSLEAIDAVTRVLTELFPPFQKGELFPPVSMVHSGSVCLGIVDRAFRFANNQDVQLALEAAEFNQAVMMRLEETFFLSSTIWETMDADMSGEITVEEFVEGMRKADVYKDFRKERVPEDVLRTIVGDLAERLFQEVDINMDGTLTHAELSVVYRRRREEALKSRREKGWLYRLRRALALQTGFGLSEKKGLNDPHRAEALEVQKNARATASVRERQRANEWLSEMDRVHLLDEDVDVDTNVPVTQL